MAFWLVKSEAEVYSLADLKRDRSTRWDCVRNYQARNFLREFKPKERVLFYHSNSEPTGIIGLAEVSKVAYPDPTQFDSSSEYYDTKASAADPRWYSPEIRYLQSFKRTITLAELRTDKALKDMLLLQRGSRLSVQPVSLKEFNTIVALAKK